MDVVDRIASVPTTGTINPRPLYKMKTVELLGGLIFCTYGLSLRR